ncbi:TetR/AcrR family transcriptional regulator [Nocardioides alcanivorans]|uniref:TetR/AcrR family transcriptional regulator n=1 Tax=Nocardioides alcanivorans TaxID=2897352 RepID=UPI001F3A8F95|nr:TetR/AcrR family transcriptional regulator [Nocardioides alcanivorans]
MERQIVRRPKNRRAQIKQVASAQFYKSGYHDVTMESIAKEVGITVPGLYRHFDSKQALLDEVVHDEGADYRQTAVGSDALPLAELAGRMIDRSVDRHGVAALAYTHLRECSPAMAEQIRAAVVDNSRNLGAALHRERPELSADDIRLLGRSMLTVCDSPARYRTRVGAARQARVVRAAVDRMSRLELSQARRAGQAEPAVADLPQVFGDGRREQILSAMVTLTRARGFHGVTMELLASTLSMAPSSLYNHFDSKEGVLKAALSRIAGRMRRDLDDAIENSPADAVEVTMRNYVRLALAPDSPVPLLISEGKVLPRESRREQVDHVTKWIEILPGDPSESQLRLHAALGIVNVIAQVESMRTRPHIIDDTVTMALAVLDVPRSDNAPGIVSAEA